MNLDTSGEAVKEVAEKMAGIRPGLTMDGKGWEAFLKYYLEGNNPALLKDLVFASEGDTCRAWYKKISGFTKVKGVSLSNYILTLFGESQGKGAYCVIRDEETTSTGNEPSPAGKVNTICRTQRTGCRTSFSGAPCPGALTELNIERKEAK